MFNNFYNNCEKLIRTFSRLAQNYNIVWNFFEINKKAQKTKKTFLEINEKFYLTWNRSVEIWVVGLMY